MKKRLLILIIVVVLSLSSVSLIACGRNLDDQNQLPEQSTQTKSYTNDELYYNAVIDAIVAEENEIMPLVNLTETSDMATFNDGKVLLITFHHYPQSYEAGTVNSNINYEMWTFTDKEIKFWYENNNEGVTDWHLRFCQLLGMSETSTNSYFAGVWADVDDVIRPAYQIDVTKPMTTSLDDSISQEYKNWFNDNYVYSFSSQRLDWRNPWTRLGYTYDWANNGKEYGLSEFLIKKGADVEVAFNKTIEEFVTYLAK